jgi:Flp pilus assembly protein CpaB
VVRRGMWGWGEHGRGAEGDAGDAPGEQAGPRRRVRDRPVLPSARAAVGGLLLALSGIGTFVAWQQASGTPDHRYLVAGRPIHAGQRQTEADVRSVAVELPGGLAGRAFGDVGDVVGRVALGPIAEGELVQGGQVSEPGSGLPTAEVSFAVPLDRAVDGNLQSGDRVDVFVTYPDLTAAIARGVPVVSAAGADAFGAPGQVTVTVDLDAAQPQAQLIHAVRAGEVTLVRSTQAAAAEGGGWPSGPGPEGGDVFRPGDLGGGA